jgi:hypothetical protein
MSTLSQLRTEAKQRADMVNASFVSDDEWNAWINRGMQEVYGLTAEVFGGEYFVQSPVTGYTFTTDGIAQQFTLPSDFFKLLGVDVLYGSANQWVELKPFNLADRNRFSGSNQSIPAAGQTVRLLYVPTYTPMTLDASTPPAALVLNGWEEFAVAHATRLALLKEESDTSVPDRILAELRARVQAEAENRDAANPKKMVDSRDRGSPMMAYNIYGGYLWLIGQRVIGQPYYGYANPADGWW